jgi:DNA (cytosine-5)-methyltransferase 3A
MNVLSLFDGGSCGQLALHRAGIPVDKYYASEVDPYAIKVTQKNWPNTIQLGDIRNITKDTVENIDIIFGGSPCQDFSSAGRRDGMSTTDNKDITSLDQYLSLKEKGYEFKGQSYLFWEFVRVLKEIKPKYFLLENIKMKKEWADIITQTLGVEPIEINSSTIVPQRRLRYYWTNIPFHGIEKVDYNVSDYIDGEGFPSQCDRSRYFRNSKIFGTLVATYMKGIRGCRPAVSTKEGNYDEDRSPHRMLSPEECERLQTLPVGYTEGISKTQRYRVIGNGWTVDVLKNIFKNLK